MYPLTVPISWGNCELWLVLGIIKLMEIHSNLLSRLMQMYAKFEGFFPLAVKKLLGLAIFYDPWKCWLMIAPRKPFTLLGANSHPFPNRARLWVHDFAFSRGGDIFSSLHGKGLEHQISASYGFFGMLKLRIFFWKERFPWDSNHHYNNGC